MKRSYKVAEACCPKCCSAINAATPIERGTAKPPKPGDLSVCAKCFTVLLYTDGLGVRAATVEELRRLPRAVCVQLQHARLILRKIADSN